MLGEDHDLYREEFPLILADLRHAADGTVIEGAALLPELLAALGVPPDHAVWIVPAPEFQLRHYQQRTWAHDLLAGTASPEEAFTRWMQRDALFAQRVAAQATDLGYRVIVTDGSAGATQLAAGLV
ncbi:hypothetical protein AB0F81_27165 [Actinoplanes sp. NPDC024001]|uniref:hypothetical protein n=1 Tax=Actinoplanes sp. NPDC024001 TaxID=3154598 RepID=UPI0033F4F282